MIWFRYGILAKRARRDLRRDIRYRGNMGFERIPLWRSLDWICNQEDQSQDYRGMIFVLIKTDLYSLDVESMDIDSRLDHYTEWHRGILDLLSDGTLEIIVRILDSRIAISRICCRRYGFNGFRIWCEGTSIWNCYKRRCELELIITVSHLISLKFYISIGSILAWVIMTQSQLVGKGRDMKSGEANRKRLKFSIKYQL